MKSRALEQDEGRSRADTEEDEEEMAQYGPDPAQVLQGREELLSACGVLNENHVLLVQSRDDAMQSQLSGWMKAWFEERRVGYHARNRRRTEEVVVLVKDLSAEIRLALGADPDAVKAGYELEEGGEGEGKHEIEN